MLCPRRKGLKRFLLKVLFGVSFLIILGLGQVRDSPFHSIAIAQVPSADQWMQRGVDRYRADDFLAAIRDWEAALTAYRFDRNLEKVAIVLENLARAYQALGQPTEEIHYWEEAGSAYRQIGNRLRVGRILAEQAQAHSRIGQYGQAITLLCGNTNEPNCDQDSALGIAQSLPNRDRIGEMVAFGSLGDAYRMRGRADRAIFYLEQGLAIAEETQEPIYLISTLNSLGNAYLSRAQLNYRRALSAEQIEEENEARSLETQAQSDERRALNYLQESLARAQAVNDSSGQLRALISSLPIYYRSGETERGRRSLQQAISLIEILPNSQEKVYAAIDLARFVQLTPHSTAVPLGRQCISQTVEPQAESILGQAIVVAQQIGDRRAESFALGELGHLYECQRNDSLALELTRQAKLAADQNLQARDSLYLWLWQTGRILKAQEHYTEAIRAYEESLATLEALRKDILTTSREIQFDFRETIEPIYRELVTLRLQQEQPSILTSVSAQRGEASRDNISLALNTLDQLKLAELQNYFGNDCVLTALNQTDINFARTTPKTAIFSTVLLGDRTAVIVNIPTLSSTGEQQIQQQFEWIADENGANVKPADLIQTVNQYRRELENVRDAIEGYNLTLAQQMYDWMIRPFKPLLEQNEIQTLIFVQDGIFRSVPMSALHNGAAFLVEDYAIAVTPSLNLTNLETAERQHARALILGLTEPATVNNIDFPALRYVASELQVVEEILPRSLELRDQDFTLDRLEQALATDNYPIIHIATHGKFSTESENAFLVTGRSSTQADQRLTIDRLDDLIRQTSSRNSLELLVLSACQTAIGDDRAALGLAGIAAQAGAKRVLASLWSVNDRATTELIERFYRGLFGEETLSQAQALQAAQIALIKSGDLSTAHPAFWSAFILIGNWL